MDREVRLTGDTDTSIRLPMAETVIWPEEAWQVSETESEWVPREELSGRVSLEFVYLYPPGIPILAPGERVTEEVLAVFAKAEAERQVLKGMERPGGLLVLREE